MPHDLYRVWHERPVAVDLDTYPRRNSAAIPPQMEKVVVAQVPLAKLRDVCFLVEAAERLEIEPLGDSLPVCGMCQWSVATVDDYCEDCAEYVRGHDSVGVA